VSSPRDRMETRRGLGALIIIVSGIVPLFFPAAWMAVAAAGVGGILAGFVAGVSAGARIRYMLAGALCAAGMQTGYRLMPGLADAGKYINTIPALIGGLPGAFAYFITRDDAEAADVRWYEQEEATRQGDED
jgi:hypothetical protein